MTSLPRLLVNAVDAKARVVPDDPWLLYAKSPSWEQGGYCTITVRATGFTKFFFIFSKTLLLVLDILRLDYADSHGVKWKQFANAVDRVSFWLDANLPRAQNEPQTFAYLGPSDARYYILIVAAAKAKRRFFIPDGRITSEGLVNILQEIECVAWISTQDLPSSVPGQRSLFFPPLEEIITEDDNYIPSYPYNEIWEHAKDQIICIIHTSGTTGKPKPIYLRNGFMSVWDSWNTIFSRHHPRKITYQHMINARTLSTCAPQWLAGLAFSLNAAVFIGLITVMLPSEMYLTSPLDRQAIIQICQDTGAESIITPPSLIEDFYTDDAAFDFLKSLNYVCWVGAGLDHKVGDALAPHTNLFPVIGSTERGANLSFESDDVEMWKSYDFVPEMGAHMEKISDELYELHVDRTSEWDLFQCGFYTFPNLNSIETKELYSPTMDKNGNKRWVSRGRKDDLVKLSWLAKFHATHVEAAIARQPLVAAVFVGGEGREVPYIIIDLKDKRVGGDSNEILDEIYNTTIYSVNDKSSNEIRIPREMIMLSDPALPFKRTMKGTIMRKEVERMYESHIEDLYLEWRTRKAGNGYNPLGKIFTEKESIYEVD